MGIEIHHAPSPEPPINGVTVTSEGGMRWPLEFTLGEYSPGRGRCFIRVKATGETTHDYKLKLVTLCSHHYEPDTIRELAQALLRLADQAEVRP